MYNYFLFLYTGLFLHFLIHKKEKIVDYNMGDFYVGTFHIALSILYRKSGSWLHLKYTFLALR